MSAPNGAEDLSTPKPLFMPEWVQREVQEAEDFGVVLDNTAVESLQQLDLNTTISNEKCSNPSILIQQLLSLDPTRGVRPASKNPPVSVMSRIAHLTHPCAENDAICSQSLFFAWLQDTPPPDFVAKHHGLGPFLLRVGGLKVRFWRIMSDEPLALDGIPPNAQWYPSHSDAEKSRIMFVEDIWIDSVPTDSQKHAIC